jgi:hypothetical protein
MIIAVHGDTVSSLFLSFLSYIYRRGNRPQLGWLLCGGCKACGQNNTPGTIFGDGRSRRRIARCLQRHHGGANTAGFAHPISFALNTGGGGGGKRRSQRTRDARTAFSTGCKKGGAVSGTAARDFADPRAFAYPHFATGIGRDRGSRHRSNTPLRGYPFRAFPCLPIDII